nr:MAG TPA: hypothetical protein [Caudoviricetes sp.]
MFAFRNPCSYYSLILQTCQPFSQKKFSFCKRAVLTVSFLWGIIIFERRMAHK